eukprot:Nitzschia sp. Nitz4//scaffold91_size79674//72229//78877//NITZ4_005380-RA/size79674-augustus-gene-0.83-mRNA-1//1//CDS//3329560139//9293//frame0
MNTKHILIAVLILTLGVAATVVLLAVVGPDNNNKSNSSNLGDTDDDDDDDGSDDGGVIVDYTTTLQCPTSPNESISLDMQDTPTRFYLNHSESSTLCTLVELSADASYISPVARSYDGRDWHVSAGRFVTQIAFDCDSTNEEGVCSVVLPVPPAGAVYQLTTFDKPTYSRRDVAARFLEQATFGPTSADIDKLVGDMDAGIDFPFARWVQEQQQDIPILSHREIFRRYLNAAFPINNPIGPVTQPCQTGTRYRAVAFSDKDREATIQFRRSGDNYVLSVDDYFRTLAEGPMYYLGENGFEAVDWEDGDYDVCYIYADDDRSYLLLAHPDLGDCIFVFFGDEFHSNPPVQIDPSETFTLLEIPEGSATEIDAVYYDIFNPPEQSIILTKDLAEAECASLDTNSKEPVFAFFDSTYWIHDPRFKIFENTLKVPLQDGGGAIASLYANPYESEFRTKCSNTPRTFLNQDTCHLSMEESACSYTVREEYSRNTGAELLLTHEVIRTIYEVTAEEGDPTYAYAVVGLNITKDPTVAPPCQTEAVSRWIPVNCSDSSQGILPQTRSVLSYLINAFEEYTGNEYMVDVYLPEDLEVSCAEQDMSKVGFEVPNFAKGNCWLNVHPNHLNVYDFTDWDSTHPGNVGDRRPIAEFAEAGSTTLTFPDWHEMTRWNTYKETFPGPLRLGDTVYFEWLPYQAQSPELAQALGVEYGTTESGPNYTQPGTIVCGSPNEVSNDPFLGGSESNGAFDALTTRYQTSYYQMAAQRSMIWTHAALNDPGQLRQRVAWALAQILVISPGSLSNADWLTEAFVTYYDIFVRHAFGNYRDILKEVSFSPMMADMLTYYGGRSTAFVWAEEGNTEFADENYAREIMQLFTTGLFRLHLNGTQVLDSENNAVRVYTNDDIEEYARVWTGFLSQMQRGNIEIPYQNVIDPMYIEVEYRDRFPKMGLDRKYIGDGYPSCADLPSFNFLSTGAKFRLLGSSPKPESLVSPPSWYEGQHNGFLELKPEGDLYNILCNPDSSGECTFPVDVELDETLPCHDAECDVDTIRVVKVNEMYFEYVRPRCVHQAFYNNAKTVNRRWGGSNIMCSDPTLAIATPACCNGDYDSWRWGETFFGERTTYSTANERCDGHVCPAIDIPSCDEETVGMACDANNYHWNSEDCALGVAIGKSGKVALLHMPSGVNHDDVDPAVSATQSKTFFRVDWSGDFNTIIDNCDADARCKMLSDGLCRCEVSVVENAVFDRIPTSEEILASLSIGAIEPEGSSDLVVNGVSVHNLGSDGQATTETIFGTEDFNGNLHWRINKQSTVIVGESMIGFRNPPHFIHLSSPEPFEAYHETDAALDQYFYHPNTAPFIAIRFAQRFGVSNPSPRYVASIATAFKEGIFKVMNTEDNISFGSGKYGDLSATVAATLLDEEARNILLDMDPAHGSLKEPLIKLIGLMRSLGFELNDDERWVEFGRDVGQKLGQMSHEIPNVFSFFLPEYQPAGPVAQGSLVSPESQVLTGPRIIDSLNGMYSLIRYGLNHCFGGFGNEERVRNNPSCDQVVSNPNAGRGFGDLTYEPDTGLMAKEIVNELATLLTAGRLSPENRQTVIDAVTRAPAGNKAAIAELLVGTSPEFHATNLVKRNGETRESEPSPSPSNKPYKALVYVLLDGGMDSYNMLAPHSCSVTNSEGRTLLEQYYTERTTVALSEDERSLLIDVDGQPCSQFAVHPDLPTAHRLYNDKDLAFIANVGALDTQVTKDNYYALTRTELFAHNTMKEGAQRVDPWDSAPGTGILGRMADILHWKGYSPRPVTVSDATVATVGVPGNSSVSPVIVSENGLTLLDGEPAGKSFDVADYAARLNNGTSLHSSVFAETWSQKLSKAMVDANQLVGAIEGVELDQEYEGNEYLSKMGAVSSMILTNEALGVDRDVIFVQLGSWDHHDNMKASLSNEFQGLDSALHAFEAEMKAQNLWDQVTLVVTSEFARTLTANSGEGTDHAWGGNYMIMGGSLNGGNILGDYPSDITPNGPLNLGRGRLIPTLSWESMFSGILGWMGIEGDNEMDYCMPNRAGTGTHLFSVEEMFST